MYAKERKIADWVWNVMKSLMCHYYVNGNGDLIKK